MQNKRWWLMETIGDHSVTQENLYAARCTDGCPLVIPRSTRQQSYGLTTESIWHIARPKWKRPQEGGNACRCWLLGSFGSYSHSWKYFMEPFASVVSQGFRRLFDAYKILMHSWFSMNLYKDRRVTLYCLPTLNVFSYIIYLCCHLSLYIISII